MDINLEFYRGSSLEKSFNTEKDKAIEIIENKLKDNFSKGLIDEDLFIKASQELDLIKGIDPSNGGKLKMVHIVDKNGHHRVVWKSPVDIKKLEDSKEHDHVEEVKQGHSVTYNGETHIIHSVKDKGNYITLKGPDGKTHDKSINKIEFHNPKQQQSKKEKETIKHSNEKPNIKVGDVVDKEGTEGKVLSIDDNNQMAQVDFSGNVYGITFSRFNSGEVKKKDAESLKEEDLQKMPLETLQTLYTGLLQNHNNVLNSRGENKQQAIINSNKNLDVVGKIIDEKKTNSKEIIPYLSDKELNELKIDDTLTNYLAKKGSLSRTLYRDDNEEGKRKIEIKKEIEKLESKITPSQRSLIKFINSLEEKNVFVEMTCLGKITDVNIIKKLQEPKIYNGLVNLGKITPIILEFVKIGPEGDGITWKHGNGGNDTSLYDMDGEGKLDKRLLLRNKRDREDKLKNTSYSDESDRHEIDLKTINALVNALVGKTEPTKEEKPKMSKQELIDNVKDKIRTIDFSGTGINSGIKIDVDENKKTANIKIEFPRQFRKPEEYPGFEGSATYKKIAKVEQKLAEIEKYVVDQGYKINTSA